MKLRRIDTFGTCAYLIIDKHFFSLEYGQAQQRYNITFAPNYKYTRSDHGNLQYIQNIEIKALPDIFRDGT